MPVSDSGYGNVSAPWWDRVWIVAGGPSARGFDFSRLRGETVLAVNDAVDHFLPPGVPAAVFSLDNNWIRRRRVFLAGFPGEKYLALPLETWPDCADIPGAVYLRWEHADGLSDDPGAINTGGNSGYGALNLAYLKHAREIHLIGYDMDPGDFDQYYHWALAFPRALPQLQGRGARVVNHNPQSFITCFEFA